jgi:hypothetical protein
MSEEYPPIAVIIHQRPLLVKLLLERAKSCRPSRLWIIADGPAALQGEVGRILCVNAREEAEKGISWECEVRKVYSETNLGLDARIETGLDAVFAEEKHAVILEEDCHPKADFFPFMQAMLARYQDEEKIAAVSGNCYLPAHVPLECDYFFSRYVQIWGWATWRRAWNQHRAQKFSWPCEGFAEYFPKSKRDEQDYWNLVMKRVVDGGLQSWDYHFLWFFWKENRLAVLPSQNLVDNLGFGVNATNTGDSATDPGWQRQGRLIPPYRSPGQILESEALDSLIFQNHYKRMSGRKSVFEKIQHLFA